MSGKSATKLEVMSHMIIAVYWAVKHQIKQTNNLMIDDNYYSYYPIKSPRRLGLHDLKVRKVTVNSFLLLRN